MATKPVTSAVASWSPLTVEQLAGLTSCELAELKQRLQTVMQGSLQAIKKAEDTLVREERDLQVADWTQLFKALGEIVPSTKKKKTLEKKVQAFKAALAEVTEEKTLQGLTFSDVNAFLQGLSAMVKLRTLSIEKVTIKREHPPMSIALGANLRQLTLASIPFRVVLAILAPLNELRVLAIKECMVEGNLGDFGAKQHLISMNIMGSKNTSLGRMNDLMDAPELRVLRLVNCGIKGSIFHLNSADKSGIQGKYPQLQVLNLSFNPIVGALYDVTGTYSKLETLILMGCHLNQDIVAAREWIQKRQKLSVVNMVDIRKGAGVHADFTKRPELQDNARLMQALEVPLDKIERVKNHMIRGQAMIEKPSSDGNGDVWITSAKDGTIFNHGAGERGLTAAFHAALEVGGEATAVTDQAANGASADESSAAKPKPIAEEAGWTAVGTKKGKSRKKKR